MPPLSLLILDPSNYIEYLMPVLMGKRKLWALTIFLININKRLPSFDVINNQMIVKINGVTAMGVLRIYIVSCYSS